MLVKDLMSKDAISVTSQDTLSTALSKMKKHRIHQLVVLDGNNLRGMLTLNKIISHESDPSKAKVESLISSVHSLGPEDNAEDAARYVLLSGLRALPVVDTSVAGVLSETDLLVIADSEYKVENIMTECECIEKGGNFGRVKELMLQKSVSRLPVVDNGKVVGVINTLDLIDFLLKSKEDFPEGGRTKQRGAKEKINTGATPVTYFMREPHLVSKDAKLKDVREILKKKEEVLIEYDGRVYIVTPKDVLETVVKKLSKKGVYVQVTGLKKEQANLLLDKEIEDTARKIGKMIDTHSLILHVEEHRKQGDKIKYSVRARLMTSLGMFIAKSWGWEPLEVIQELKRKLLKEVERKHGKLSHHEAEKKSKELLRD